MTKSFDIRTESLATGVSAASLTAERASASRGERAHGTTDLAPGASSSSLASGKSFFIETFGCQMNVHDAEKVAGVLLARGYRPAASIADADLMLYNTCSIREKAAQKVFSRLGEWRYTIGSKVI